MRGLTFPELPEHSAAELKRAIHIAIGQQAQDVAAPSVGPRSLSGRLPSAARLENGAEQLAQESPEDAEAVRYFKAMIEASYLVAAADGLAKEEHDALSDLIAHTTGSAVDAKTLQEMFSRFDGQLEEQGLEGRLQAISSSFDDFMAREEAMSFAALIAISDGVLAPSEEVALIALGARLDFSTGEVQAILNQVAAALSEALSCAAAVSSLAVSSLEAPEE